MERSSAIGPGYTQAGLTGFTPSQGFAGAAKEINPVRRTTDMESLSERLASNLGILQEINSRLETRLNAFQSVNSLESSSTKDPAAPPPPGSHAYLQSLTDATSEQLTRLNELASRVSAIL